MQERMKISMFYAFLLQYAFCSQYCIRHCGCHYDCVFIFTCFWCTPTHVQAE